MKQIFVKNLPPKISNTKVVDYFKRFGDIQKYKVNNRDRSAWIAYDTEMCAELATSRAPHMIGNVRVYVQRNWYHEYLKKNKEVGGRR